MNINRLRWYYYRFRKFSFAEIIFRIEEQLKRQAENISCAFGSPIPQEQRLIDLLNGAQPTTILQTPPSSFPALANLDYPQYIIATAQQTIEYYQEGKLLLFGEWDGTYLHPLTVAAEGRWLQINTLRGVAKKKK